MQTKPNPTHTIAYVIGVFPQYAFTFVCQEVVHLLEAGFNVEIFALKRGRKEELHESFQQLWEKITCIERRGIKGQLIDYLYFQLRHPFRMLALYRTLKPYANNEKRFLRDNYLLPAYSIARSIAKRNDIVYLHSHFTMRDSTLAYMISKLLNLPRGFTTHADVFAPAKFKMLAEQVRDSAVVFTISRQARDCLLNLFSGDEHKHVSSKIVLKPVGVDLRLFYPVEAIPPRTKLISVCRFEAKKGLMYLVKACKLLIERGHAIDCLMIGDARGEDAEAIFQEIANFRKSHRLEAHLTIAGFLPQPEIAARLRSRAVFVAPYIVADSGKRDGIPTGIIEAMAAGVVPVATDAGAITELVTHMENGLVVPQKDEAALADAIERLINDGSLYERLRENAINKARAERDVNRTETILVEKMRQICRLPSN